MSRRRRKAAASRGPVVKLDDYRDGSGGGGGGPEMGKRTPQPSIRQWDRARFNELDFGTVVNILRRGEEGDTEQLADLWLRMLKTDAHLESVWESRLAPIYSARWEITPAPVKTRARNAKRAAEGCAQALRYTQDLPTVFSALLNARGVGFAVCEIVWERGELLGQEAFVPKLLPIHPRRFRFADSFEIGLYDDGRAVPQLRAAGWYVEEISGRNTAIARLPAGKYVVHQPIGIHDYPTATGLVHTLVRWWWVKQAATKYWLAGAEMSANPRLIGKLLQNAGATTMEEFHEGLEKLAADGVIVLREGTEVEIVEGKAKASSEVWDTLFSRMDLAISKGVLGSTLNVEIDSTGGNRAASESQDAVTIRPRQRQDAAQMWSTLERDLFRYVLAYNPHVFAPDSPCPKGASILVEEQVTIDQLAVDGGVVRKDELRRSRGLPEWGGDLGQEIVAPITREPGEEKMPDAAEETPPEA